MDDGQEVSLDDVPTLADAVEPLGPPMPQCDDALNSHRDSTAFDIDDAADVEAVLGPEPTAADRFAVGIDMDASQADDARASGEYDVGDVDDEPAHMLVVDATERTMLDAEVALALDDEMHDMLGRRTCVPADLLMAADLDAAGLAYDDTLEDPLAFFPPSDLVIGALGERTTAAPETVPSPADPAEPEIRMSNTVALALATPPVPPALLPAQADALNTGTTVSLPLPALGVTRFLLPTDALKAFVQHPPAAKRVKVIQAPRSASEFEDEIDAETARALCAAKTALHAHAAHPDIPPIPELIF